MNGGILTVCDRRGQHPRSLPVCSACHANDPKGRRIAPGFLSWELAEIASCTHPNHPTPEDEAKLARSRAVVKAAYDAMKG